MATNYPSGLDSLSNPAGSDALSTGHASQHANANDAIEAIEGELGLNPRGGSATVKARFDAIEANSWVTSARIADGTITGTDIASGTVTSTNILDGTIVNADINASAAIDVSKLSGVVTSAGVGNLLSSNVASGTDTSADTTGYTLAGVGTVLTSSTAQAFQGSRSLEASQPTSGTFGINIGVVGNTATMIPVVAGQTYTLMTQARTSVARTVTVKIYWRTAAGAAVSTVSADTSCVDTAWTACRVTGVAPATAAYVIAEVSAVATGAEDMYLDCLGFWQGAGGLWALPGTPIANLGTYTDESVGRRIFTWDTVNARWQMTFGDTGVRSLTLTPINVCASLAVNVRRFGATCHIDVLWTNTAMTLPLADTALTSTGLPSGFLPNDSVPRPAYTGYSGTIGGVIKLASGTGILSAQVPAGGMGAGGGSAMLASWEYSTTDAWPSSLPGSPLGSIPT